MILMNILAEIMDFFAHHESFPVLSLLPPPEAARDGVDGGHGGGGGSHHQHSITRGALPEAAMVKSVNYLKQK